jgi:hypothetical protein
MNKLSPISGENVSLAHHSKLRAGAHCLAHALCITFLPAVEDSEYPFFFVFFAHLYLAKEKSAMLAESLGL